MLGSLFFSNRWKLEYQLHFLGLLHGNRETYSIHCRRAWFGLHVGNGSEFVVAMNSQAGWLALDLIACIESGTFVSTVSDCFLVVFCMHFSNGRPSTQQRHQAAKNGSSRLYTLFESVCCHYPLVITKLVCTTPSTGKTSMTSPTDLVRFQPPRLHCWWFISKTWPCW